jgi:hypothetical protein
VDVVPGDDPAPAQPRSFNILNRGVEVLTGLLIGAKELAFGLVLAPLSILEGTGFGLYHGYSESRRNGSGVVESLFNSLGQGFTDTFTRGLPNFFEAIDKADNALAVRLGNLDRSNLTIGESLNDLVGAIPLVGHIISGGNRPDVALSGDRYIVGSQGIRATTAENDIQRHAPLQSELETLGAADGRGVFQTTYPHGTILDVGMSLLNLSNGYAYDAARQILNQGVGPGDVIDFVAHSGGVQRMAMASRILATMISMVIGWPGSQVRSWARITI